MRSGWTRPTFWILTTFAGIACGSSDDTGLPSPGPPPQDGQASSSGAPGTDPDGSLPDGGVVPQGFALISDLNTRSEAVVPHDFVELGSLFLFTTYESNHGERLFASDGTAAGTTLLATFGAGLAQPGTLSVDLHDGKALGDQLFFTANDGVHGQELWRTDGTPQGTMLALDLNPGPGAGSGPNSLTSMGGSLYFYAVTATGGPRTLWKSDGTSAGTTALTEQYDSTLAVLGNQLIFAAGGTDPQGREPWVSDGTVAGTHLLRDVFPGTQGGQPNSFTTVGSRVFFWANDGVHGNEAWSTDGTEVGTVLAADVNPGSADGQGSQYTFSALGTDALFLANDGSTGHELWRSNGVGATRVKDLAPGAASSNAFAGAVLGGQLYFTATDGSSGLELWKTDGSELGTSLVKDIAPGPASGRPAAFVAYGSTLLFTADDGIHGDELWRSDGTEAGTWLVKDIRPGSASAGVGYVHARSQPTVVQGKVLFAADDATRDQALYTTDGTEAGTTVFADLTSGATSSSVDPSQLAAAVGGGKMLFLATDGNGAPAPYASDGTASGTHRLAELVTTLPRRGDRDRVFPAPVAAGAQFFFAASDASHGLELWCSDGTPAGTRLTRDIQPGAAAGIAITQPLLASGSSVYFAGPGGLWKSDGSEAGTVTALDQSVATNVFRLGTSTPQTFDLAGTILFFGARAGSSGLYRVDGTTATALGAALGPDYLVDGTVEGAAVGNELYFTTGAGTLWSSDGTAEGTRQIATIGTGRTASVHGFVALGSQVAFVGDDGSGGAQLWASDGTAEGTRRVISINPAGNAIAVQAGMPFATAHEGRLLFAATDAASGAELWASDLTAAGTVQVADIASGNVGSNPTGFVAYRSQVYFSANDGIHGTELWRSDGTAAGTLLVGDLHAGPGSSPSMPTFVLGSDLILFGTEGVHGVEPWRFTAP